MKHDLQWVGFIDLKPHSRLWSLPFTYHYSLTTYHDSGA